MGRKFKGPSPWRRTGKRGFFIGMVLGLAAWLVSLNNPESGLTPQVLTLVGVVGGVSIILVILGYVRRRATLTPFGDGLVFGVALLFDILRLASSGVR